MAKTYNFQINTDKEEMLESLRQLILEKPFINNLWYLNIRRTKNYLGIINEEYNSFRIQPIVVFTSAPLIEIEGKLYYEDDKCRIAVHFSYTVWFYLFVAILSLFGIVMLTTISFGGSFFGNELSWIWEFLIIIGMLIIFSSFLLINPIIERKQFLKRLKKTIS